MLYGPGADVAPHRIEREPAGGRRQQRSERRRVLPVERRLQVAVEVDRVIRVTEDDEESGPVDHLPTRRDRHGAHEIQYAAASRRDDWRVDEGAARRPGWRRGTAHLSAGVRDRVRGAIEGAHCRAPDAGQPGGFRGRSIGGGSSAPGFWPSSASPPPSRTGEAPA